jgi:hypothetical protein
MRPWLQAGLCSLVLAIAPTVGAAPKGNAPSTSAPGEAQILRRVGYQPPEGARLVSKTYPSPDGEQVAFFEERGGALQLVVAIRGGVSARWPVSSEHAKLQVYWVGASEVILGTDLLSPKARVRWYVARAG